MGLLVKPGEIKSQTNSMNQSLKKDNQSLEGILPSIDAFVSEGALDGDAWQGLKEQLSGHQAIIQGLISANEAMISDGEELASAAGSKDLDEDKIVAEIERLNNQNKSYQSTIQGYEVSRGQLKTESLGLGNVLDIFVNYYTQQINHYNQLITRNEHTIINLNRDLEELYAIESATQGLFKDSVTLFIAVSEGMAALGASWTGSGFSLPANSTWQETIHASWENSEYKMRKELEEAGWDKAAIKAYQEYLKKELKGLRGQERIDKIKQIHDDTYLVGSRVYERMFDSSKLSSKEKVALVLNQMNAQIDENGFLQISGKYKFNPNMPPHDSFLKKYAKCVRDTYPKSKLKDEGVFGQKIHLFRSYLDKHNIEYIRSHFEGKNDYERLKAYAEKYKIEFDYSTGASLHNRTLGAFKYTQNMKVLAPKQFENDGGRMSEFIINLETGNFVSQWNVYQQRADGSYESDLSQYDINKSGDIGNTESFNYGPSKGENEDRPKGDNGSHSRLDVNRPDDAEIRAAVTEQWKSPKDFDEDGNYADIVKKGEVDYEAWREVPENKREEIYKVFVEYCRNNGNDNPGFNIFWKKHKK